MPENLQPAPAQPPAGTVFGMAGWPLTAANLSAVGVLIWLVMVQMPRNEDRYFQEIAAQRTMTQEITSKLSGSIEANTQAVRDLSSETRGLRRDRKDQQ